MTKENNTNNVVDLINLDNTVNIAITDNIHCVEVNKIFCTYDYEIFHYQVGNRDILENKVKKVIKKIKKNKYDTAFPIVVNKNMEIIDGQHRYEALKRLGLPIIFCVSSNEGNLQETIDINNTRTNWNINNYIKSCAAEGNTHYQTLLQLMQEFDYDCYVTLGFLLGRPTGGPDTIKIKEKQIQISPEMLHTFYEINKEYQQLLACIKCQKHKKEFKKKAFAHAYIDIRRQPNFNFKRMLAVMKKDEGTFISVGEGEYNKYYRYKHLQQLYNKGLRDDNKI